MAIWGYTEDRQVCPRLYTCFYNSVTKAGIESDIYDNYLT